MMMKHAQTILAKVKLRIIFYSGSLPLDFSVFVIVVLSVSSRYAVLSERDLIHRLFPHVHEGQACLGGAGRISSWFSVLWWMVRQSFHKYGFLN